MRVSAANIYKHIRKYGYEKVARLTGACRWNSYPAGVGKCISLEKVKNEDRYFIELFLLVSPDEYENADRLSIVIRKWRILLGNPVVFTANQDCYSADEFDRVIEVLDCVAVPWLDRFSDKDFLLSYMERTFYEGVPAEERGDVGSPLSIPPLGYAPDKGTIDSARCVARLAEAVADNEMAKIWYSRALEIWLGNSPGPEHFRDDIYKFYRRKLDKYS